MPSSSDVVITGSGFEELIVPPKLRTSGKSTRMSDDEVGFLEPGQGLSQYTTLHHTIATEVITLKWALTGRDS